MVISFVAVIECCKHPVCFLALLNDIRLRILAVECCYVCTAVNNKIMEVFQHSPFIYSNYKTSDCQERAGKQYKAKEELECRKY